MNWIKQRQSCGLPKKRCRESKPVFRRSLHVWKNERYRFKRIMTILSQKLWEEYQLTRSEAMGLAIEIDNLIAAQRDLNEIKSKIKNLGSVNVGAIEEYKEVSERYTFMKNQIDDVEESKSELTSLISDLTEKMENIFAESFQKINEHFGKIFVELFGGGKAELLLTEPENVLESRHRN